MSWTFFKEFIRNRQHTGAIAPSSVHLARRMVESAGVAQARNILELGPGTGVFTKLIHDTMPTGARYLGIEINEAFAQSLRSRFPVLNFEVCPAQEFDFSSFLGQEGAFDCIVSGLPWTAFPESLQTAILDNVLPKLKPGGTFVTFAYTGLHLLPGGRRFLGLLRSKCDQVYMSRTVLRNVPPALVYQARVWAA